MKFSASLCLMFTLFCLRLPAQSPPTSSVAVPAPELIPEIDDSLSTMTVFDGVVDDESSVTIAGGDPQIQIHAIGGNSGKNSFLLEIPSENKEIRFTASHVIGETDFCIAFDSLGIGYIVSAGTGNSPVIEYATVIASNEGSCCGSTPESIYYVNLVFNEMPTFDTSGGFITMQMFSAGRISTVNMLTGSSSLAVVAVSWPWNWTWPWSAPTPTPAAGTPVPPPAVPGPMPLPPLPPGAAPAPGAPKGMGEIVARIAIVLGNIRSKVDKCAFLHNQVRILRAIPVAGGAPIAATPGGKKMLEAYLWWIQQLGCP